MSATSPLPYDLERLDGTGISALDDKTLGILLKDLLHTMAPHAHQGMLEGAFELADGEAVAELREQAWKAIGMAESGNAYAADLAGLRDDHDLQEILGTVMNVAGERGAAEIYEPLRSLGEDFCTFLAMEIEDWETRYEAEDGLVCE